jgi:phage shock protein A
MESLEQLELCVSKLLNEHQELMLQVDALRDENKRQHEQILQAHADLHHLKQEYNNLHTAHTLLLANEASEENRAKAKQRITNIVLLVDKAIESLTQ